MVHAIRQYEAGGPEKFKWEEVEVGEPGAGEVRIRQTAVGLNFIDIYQRTGLYPVPFPAILGLEAAGVVEAVGPEVSALEAGDRVAYPAGPLGAYAEARLMPADQLAKLPETIDDVTAAAMMLKGCTVEYLIRRTYPVQAGDTVLFHAAAGGVGLIACQWLKAIGATVIGTVGSEEKAALARAHGCDHTILYRSEDVAARVREITGGAGVPVVFDSVGASTFEASLESLRPRGMLVSFGNASGPVTDVDLGILAAKGSLYVTRPTLFHYYATPQDFTAGTRALFNVVTSGEVKVEVGQTFALKDTAEAHRALEARRTTGSTVLLP